MVVHVAAVGRIRHAGLRDACDDYAGRLRRYVKLALHEVPEAGRRGPDPDAARTLEAERLLAALPDGIRLVALTREGRSLGSRDLAARLDQWRTDARDVAFLVGGAFGLAAPLIARSELALSLSALTLPHELARVVLLEQLYRAGTILRGEPYHKGS